MCQPAGRANVPGTVANPIAGKDSPKHCIIPVDAGLQGATVAVGDHRQFAAGRLRLTAPGGQPNLAARTGGKERGPGRKTGTSRIMEIDLGSAVLVITGAAQGIGEEIAALAAASGAGAMLLTDRNGSLGAAVATTLGSAGCEVDSLRRTFLRPRPRKASSPRRSRATGGWTFS
jgi:hypothetical protein